MEGTNITLGSSALHQLEVGKAPAQLWGEMQDLLLSIRKLLDTTDYLKDFEWTCPLDGLEPLPLNVSLSRKSKEEEQDTTLRKRLIPGRIGERIGGLESGIKDTEIQNLQSEITQSSNHPITHSPTHPIQQNKSEIMLEKIISQLESHQPELTAALKGDELKRKEAVQKILEREVVRVKDLKNETFMSPRDTKKDENLGLRNFPNIVLFSTSNNIKPFPVQVAGYNEVKDAKDVARLPIAAPISLEDNHKQIELFYQLKKLKSEDVTRILLEKLIGSLTLFYLTNREEKSKIIINEEDIKEQFSRKIEGEKVSEGTLNKLGNIDYPEVQSGMIYQEEEVEGKDGVRYYTPAGIKSATPSASDQTNQTTLNKLIPGESEIHPEEVSHLWTGLEEKIKEQFSRKIETPLDSLVVRWFETNKSSLIPSKELMSKVETTRNLQPEIINLQSHNERMTTPLVSNTFNIQLNQEPPKSEEEMKLLEEKIGSILIEQAKRYGIRV